MFSWSDGKTEKHYIDNLIVFCSKAKAEELREKYIKLFSELPNFKFRKYLKAQDIKFKYRYGLHIQDVWKNCKVKE